VNDALDTKVIEIVTHELGVAPGTITAATTSADVEQWDSLGHLQVCMALEAEFGVSPELEVLADLDSVPAIVRYLTDGQTGT
jgi:acyl carrier protein